MRCSLLNSTEFSGLFRNAYFNLVETYHAVHESENLTDCWVCNYAGGTDKMVSMFSRAVPHSWYQQKAVDNQLKFTPIQEIVPTTITELLQVSYIPPLKSPALLDTEMGHFCIESHDVVTQKYSITNMGYSNCNFTIELTAIWQPFPSNVSMRPCLFKSKFGYNK